MLLRKNFSRWVKLFFVISLSFLFAAIYRNAVSVIYPAVNTRAYFRQISKFSLAFMKFYLYNLFRFDALVAELVDAADLKSVGRKAVPVRFRPSAPFLKMHLSRCFFVMKNKPFCQSDFETLKKHF